MPCLELRHVFAIAESIPTILQILFEMRKYIILEN